MTTTVRPTVPAPSAAPTGTAPTGAAATGTVTTSAAPHITGAQKAVAVMRIGLGWVFLWAFLDKVFGFGYSTPSARAWINGGSPTKGFLGNVHVGPLQSVFRDLAGNVVIDWLFMLALLGLGVALILGVTLRIAAVSGSLLLLLMWAAEWPMAQFNSAGVATGSSNPLVDYHIIFAIGLAVIAALGAASPWGLGKWWSSRPVVDAHPVLR
ncbi:thiosulfate dehydrogenase [quinone] large subunit [Nakamurella panacisegetis]|uniref:Thiosulfate dehydrogenase [quinone] large subunit n=1 Tax=Nakamurella panacisegetis TaxID=1090615 RepID=A0A1H0LUX4_9ACTN|nr:DoxX family membrane protein [Nakamurella panacisegetis]SDO71700.1 thiosulfate dehydrogenase [quinone] large subunit [Nakamurella panacisegetis]